MHELMKLSYKYDALEPYFDSETLEIHHKKHHQGYVDKLNNAVRTNKELLTNPIEETLKDLSKVPKELLKPVVNFGGGVANHNFFWKILKKDVEISGEIKAAIEKKWGSFEKFKEEFAAKAASLFGSGYAWLVKSGGELEIIQTFNQESPLSKGMKPLITLDVWEHSYYLKYRNKRPEYIEAFFKVINWEEVNKIYLEEQ